MDKLWGQIEAWLRQNAPGVLEALNPGATEDELDAAEKALSISLPGDFRESYLIHNGSSRYGKFLFPAGEFLSLKRVVEEWIVWKQLVDEGTFQGDESEPDRGIHNDWYNVQWIPFTWDGAGNHHCLDLDPSAWGANGQVITMWHDAPERELVASSFRDYLELLLHKLRSGEYIYSSVHDGIVSVEDL